MIKITNMRQITQSLAENEEAEWIPPTRIAVIQGSGESIYEVGSIFSSDYPLKARRVLVVKSKEKDGESLAFELSDLLKFNPYGVKFLSD